MPDLSSHIKVKAGVRSGLIHFNGLFLPGNCYKKQLPFSYIVLVVLLLMLSLSKPSKAQYVKTYRIADSTYIHTHSAHKATFMSALLPGMGQIYNQKYWKVPILYAGFAGFLYYADYNNFVYNKYKEAYDIKVKIELGELPESEDEYQYTTKENLLNYKDTWRRYRDLCYIGMGILYVAQIIDANVDAHLFDYDITNDLSLRVEPTLLPPSQAFLSNKSNTPLGIRCSISF